MRSKTLYFNATLFKKNLLRFWPLWGGASLLGALAPLTMLMELIQSDFQNFSVQPLEMTNLYYLVLSYGVPIISLIYAALCALAVWHYLYNPKSVGMVHALPITRKGLFITNALSGLAMMLIPYAVAGGLAILISLPAGIFEPVGVLVTILGVLGLSFFYFATATAVAFVTGNPFAFAAFYFIFHFLAAIAEWIVSELMTRFYYGVSMAYDGVVEFLSPTLFLLHRLASYAEYEETVTADGWIDSGRIASVTLENGWLIAVYALAGVVFLACAWFLYQRRRSESAGDVVAVGWMKPVFRYGVALCAGVTGGMLLYNILWSGFQQGNIAEVVPMMVCMAVAGVIGYYIASMLLAKSVKVFRGSARGVLAAAAACAAICAVVALDPAGVENWTPRPEELERAAITVYGSGYGPGIDARLDTPEDLQKLLELHGAILAEKDRLSTRDGTEHASLHLTYYCGNGKWTDRDYSFSFSEEDLNQGAAGMLAALVRDPAVQEANVFGNVYNSNLENIRVTGGYLSGLYGREGTSRQELDLSREQALALEEAIRRDIQACRFGATTFMTDYEEYSHTALTGNLRIYYTASYPAEPGVRSAATVSQEVNISLSSACTETLKALEDILKDTGLRFLSEAELNERSGELGKEPDLDFESEYSNVVYPEEAIVYPETEAAAEVLH